MFVTKVWTVSQTNLLVQLYFMTPVFSYANFTVKKSEAIKQMWITWLDSGLDLYYNQ